MSYKTLFTDIKNTLEPIYILYGDEQYLIEQGISDLKKKRVNPAYEDFNYQIFDSESNGLDEILDACETLPFFEELKIVIVEGATYFQSKGKGISDAVEERLLVYIKDPSPTTTLLFIANGNIDKRKKSTKAISKAGKIIEFGRLDSGDFNKWVAKVIKGNKCVIENKDLYKLVSHFGYLDYNSSKNLLSVKNDLEKLCGGVDADKIITSTLIDKHIKKPIEGTIWNLIDAVAEKRAGKAIELLDHLIEGGEPEIKILFLINKQFRLLKKVKILLNKGYTPKVIATKLNQRSFVVEKAATQSRKFTDKRLLIIVNNCTETDIKMKTGGISSRLGIEKFIVESSLK